MSTAGQVVFVPSFECPHCHAVWSHGYSKGEPKGKATCPRCVPALDAGFEAGRLAAVRADVAYAAEHFERRADEWRGHERRATGPLAKGCAAKVEEFAGQAADCRWWLEMTQ